MPASKVSKLQRMKIVDLIELDYKIMGVAMSKMLTPATVTVVDSGGVLVDYIRVSQHRRLLQNANEKIKRAGQTL